MDPYALRHERSFQRPPLKRPSPGFWTAPGDNDRHPVEEAEAVPFGPAVAVDEDRWGEEQHADGPLPDAVDGLAREDDRGEERAGA